MAKSLTYDIIKNELESYEKKVLTFSKLISSNISQIEKSSNYKCDLTEDETEELISIVYRITGDAEPELAKDLFNLWEILKSKK